jgi:hypothetical protein
MIILLFSKRRRRRESSYMTKKKKKNSGKRIFFGLEVKRCSFSLKLGHGWHLFVGFFSKFNAHDHLCHTTFDHLCDTVVRQTLECFKTLKNLIITIMTINTNFVPQKKSQQKQRHQQLLRHFWPVHLNDKNVSSREDMFLSWHLAPASEVTGGHTLPF